MDRDTMDGDWLHQVRVVLEPAAAEAARRDPGAVALAPLVAVLRQHDAVLVNQLDAFETYVAMAEREGEERFPLARWTRASLADPAKRARHATSFSVHVGGAEVYPRTAADPLAAALEPLVGGGLVARMSRHDSNPANNPQPPPHLRG